MRARKGVGQDGRGVEEELGEVEERETVFILCCMRKESRFNKKGFKIKRLLIEDYSLLKGLATISPILL